MVDRHLTCLVGREPMQLSLGECLRSYTLYCDMFQLDLAQLVKKGCKDEDLVGLIFNTIGVR